MTKIAAAFHMPGVTLDQYDQLMKEFDVLAASDSSLTKDRVIHVAMPEEGGMFAFDVWESEEAISRLGQVLASLFEKLGITPPRPMMYQVHNTAT